MNVSSLYNNTYSYVSSFWKTTAPSVPLPLYSSPLEKAKHATKGKLTLNEICVVETGGGVGASHAMYVCAPVAMHGPDKLKECCQNLLKEAVSRGFKLLLVPTFSVNKEAGFHPIEAAEVVFAEIKNFLNIQSALKVRLITYKPANGKRDEDNYIAFKNIYDGVIKENPQFNDRLQLLEGEIQYMKGDCLVIPVGGMNYSARGAVCKAVEKAASEPKIEDDWEILEVKSDLLMDLSQCSQALEAMLIEGEKCYKLTAGEKRSLFTSLQVFTRQELIPEPLKTTKGNPSRIESAGEIFRELYLNSKGEFITDEAIAMAKLWNKNDPLQSFENENALTIHLDGIAAQGGATGGTSDLSLIIFKFLCAQKNIPVHTHFVNDEYSFLAICWKDEGMLCNILQTLSQIALEIDKNPVEALLNFLKQYPGKPFSINVGSFSPSKYSCTLKLCPSEKDFTIAIDHISPNYNVKNFEKHIRSYIEKK